MDELREQCEELIAKLAERYGGDKKRLESLKRMGYMDRDIDGSFLVKNCPKVYKKSCTAVLTERGILRVPYYIKADLSPVTHKVTLDGLALTIKYQPCRLLEPFGEKIDAAMNGGYPWDLANSPAPKLQDPASTAQAIHDMRVEDVSDTEISEVPLDHGVALMKAFVNCCLLFLDKANLERIATAAPRKADGSLHLRRRTPITWTGIAIDKYAYALDLVTKSEKELKLEIKHVACDNRFYQKYKDVPDALAYLN